MQQVRSSIAENASGRGQSPAPRRAVTLLELVLVMVVISTAMALAAPSLRGFWRNADSRDAAQQFVSVARYAQTKAASGSVTLRLNIDSGGREYWLSVREGVDFVELRNDFGRRFAIPREGRIELLPVRSPFTGAVSEVQGRTYLDFFPDGRTEPARVRIYDGENEAFVECSSPAESFRELSAEEARR